MNWSDLCGVVIPCRDEARSIREVISGVQRCLRVVVVVDDGSSDETAAQASAAGAVVLRHERPRGKGAALGTGLSWLCDRGMSWGLLMDGDGQHASADIPLFLKRAARGDVGMIIGNRMDNAGSMPWIRRRVNRWMSQRISRLTGETLADSQCGFRMLRLDVWNRLRVESSHFEIESELLTAFLGAGHAVAFVPIQCRYSNQVSHIRPLTDSVRWLRWWFRAKRQNRKSAATIQLRPGSFKPEP